MSNTSTPSGYKQTEIGRIPIDWDVKTLGELFEITSSKRVFQSEWKSEGVPFYRTRELVVLAERGYVDNDLFISEELYSIHRSGYGVPQTGDVLVTGVGTIGKLYVVPNDSRFYFKDGNIIWFKSAGKINPYFLKQLYLTRQIINQITGASAGTTVGTYTITNAGKTVIPFPPTAEQTAIATALSDTDTLITRLGDLVARKKNIKQGAMSELLTGRRRLPGFSGETRVVSINELVQKITGVWGFSEPAQGRSRFVEVIRSGDIAPDGRLIDSAKRYVAETTFSKSECKIDDVVITTSGNGLGKVWWCDGRPNVMASNFVRILRPLPGCVQGKYLYQVIRSEMGRAQLLEHTATSAYPNLMPTFYNVQWIKIPPLDEQREISSILSDMDVDIERLEQEIVKYRNLKQGMMQQLLTGKIRLV